MHIYYKALSRSKKALVSGYTPFEALKVTYSTKHFASAPDIAKAKGFGLFVFETFEDAYSYYIQGSMLILIRPCFVEGIFEQLPEPVSYIDAYDFFAGRLPTSILISRTPWPQGTVMVEQVRLLTQKETREYNAQTIN